jgi:hypothetical protein
MTASALASSVPQTPLETPASVATSPSNANEFIIAIAAQERRVLELKEELAQAEVELAKLKKQWASEEVYRVIARGLNSMEALRPALTMMPWWLHDAASNWIAGSKSSTAKLLPHRLAAR